MRLLKFSRQPVESFQKFREIFALSVDKKTERHRIAETIVLRHRLLKQSRKTSGLTEKIIQR